MPGYALSLLTLSGSNEVDVQIRQSASIYFKKLAKSCWEERTEEEDDDNNNNGEVAQEVKSPEGKERSELLLSRRIFEKLDSILHSFLY